MLRILRMTMVGIMLAFAATGVAQARGNFDRGGVGSVFDQSHPGYAGPMYSSPSWKFVPGRGIVGESCEMPTSACSNDERVTG